jgi:hypothetical protein
MSIFLLHLRSHFSVSAITEGYVVPTLLYLLSHVEAFALC